MYRITALLLVLTTSIASAQTNGLTAQIDSLLGAPNPAPFNGIIQIVQNGHPVYTASRGYANIAGKVPLRMNDQFVIGSVSKQITAVLVLREYDKGHLRLDVPIKKYLPELTQPWADSVTIHHLLTHTHGIPELEPPGFSYANISPTLSFRPGTAYDYSQVGFKLMADIIERTSGKSFIQLSADLFRLCGMTRSTHPLASHNVNFVTGHVMRNGNPAPIPTDSTINNVHIAAGSFVSTPGDLLIWNKCLHGGKLLKPQTYKLMITKQKNAIRQHRLFGPTCYGYGITVDDQNGLLQLGQTGFSPGFVSMNFYYPATKTSVIILENEVTDIFNLKNSFYYHLAILKLLKESNLVQQNKSLK